MQGALDTVQAWTGDAPFTCPWDAFRDPFGARVMGAYRFLESGNLGAVLSAPSYRLVQGIAHYHYVDSRITAMKYEKDREESRARG